jgi:hypothetical protein
MCGGCVGNTANYSAVTSPNSANVIESNDRLKSTFMLEDSVHLFSIKITVFFFWAPTLYTLVQLTAHKTVLLVVAAVRNSSPKQSHLSPPPRLFLPLLFFLIFYILIAFFTSWTLLIFISLYLRFTVNLFKMSP